MTKRSIPVPRASRERAVRCKPFGRQEEGRFGAGWLKPVGRPVPPTLRVNECAAFCREVRWYHGARFVLCGRRAFLFARIPRATASVRLRAAGAQEGKTRGFPLLRITLFLQGALRAQRCVLPNGCHPTAGRNSKGDLPPQRALPRRWRCIRKPINLIQKEIEP